MSDVNLNGLLNLSGTEAACADPESFGSSVNYSLNWLKVGRPCFLSANMGMTYLHTYTFAFAANITFIGHRIHLLNSGVAHVFR